MTNKLIDKKSLSFWDLKPFRFVGKDSGRLSSIVDEIIYQWKKLIK